MESMNKTKVRGAKMVRAILADEHTQMQGRAYRRIRHYLVGALYRLRTAYPGFKTVVFNAERAGFAFVFVDGTRHHEAPKAFRGLHAVCEDLARMPEIEALTAADALWQLKHGTPQPEFVIEQYRHVQDKDWNFWMRCSLADARYSMRQTIYSRTVYGSHRPGHGKRIVGEDGVVVDEWTDPIDVMILRVLNELGAPIGLESLEDALNKMARFDHQAHYIWDVLHACNRLVERRMLRRINPRSSEIAARFALRGSVKAAQG